MRPSHKVNPRIAARRGTKRKKDLSLRRELRLLLNLNKSHVAKTPDERTASLVRYLVHHTDLSNQHPRPPSQSSYIAPLPYQPTEIQEDDHPHFRPINTDNSEYPQPFQPSLPLHGYPSPSTVNDCGPPPPRFTPLHCVPKPAAMAHSLYKPTDSLPASASSNSTASLVSTGSNTTPIEPHSSIAEVKTLKAKVLQLELENKNLKQQVSSLQNHISGRLSAIICTMKTLEADLQDPDLGQIMENETRKIFVDSVSSNSDNSASEVELSPGSKIFLSEVQISEILLSGSGNPKKIVRGLLDTMFTNEQLAATSAKGQGRNRGIPKTYRAAILYFANKMRSAGGEALQASDVVQIINSRCGSARRHAKRQDGKKQDSYESVMLSPEHYMNQQQELHNPVMLGPEHYMNQQQELLDPLKLETEVLLFKQETQDLNK